VTLSGAIDVTAISCHESLNEGVIEVTPIRAAF